VRGHPGLKYTTLSDFQYDGFTHFLQHGLKFTPQQLTDQTANIAQLNDSIDRMALASIDPNLKAEDFNIFKAFGWMISSLPAVGEMRKEWYVQVLHTDFSAEYLHQLAILGIIVQTFIYPLSMMGSFLHVADQYDKKPQGSLLLLMPGTVTFFPGTLIHAGGFRTDIRGNPRIHGYIFVCPKDVNVPPMPEQQNLYFGVGVGDNQSFRVHPEDESKPMCAMITKKIQKLQANFGI
jgi:hypothetical protein